MFLAMGQGPPLARRLPAGEFGAVLARESGETLAQLAS